MSEIKEYKDLTRHMSDEWMNIVDAYGVQKPPKKIMDFVTKNLLKHIDLYDKPLHRLLKYEIKNMYFIQKRELQLQRAIDTMPHGKIWKFFHADLVERMEYRKKHPKEEKREEEANKPPLVESSVPAIVLPRQAPPMQIEDDF